MFKKLNELLNVIISSFIGVFAGHGIYVFYSYTTKPGLYAMQSAPWYTSIITYGIVTVLVLIVAVGIKLVIRKKWKG